MPIEWVKVSTAIMRDPNTLRVREAIGATVPTTVGHMVGVFICMAEHTPDGSLADISDGTLESWAVWTGKAGKFAAGFRAHLCDEGGTVIAWAKWNGGSLDKLAQGKARSQKFRERRSAEGRRASDKHTPEERNAQEALRVTQTGVTVTHENTTNGVTVTDRNDVRVRERVRERDKEKGGGGSGSSAEPEAGASPKPPPPPQPPLSPAQSPPPEASDPDTDAHGLVRPIYPVSEYPTLATFPRPRMDPVVAVRWAELLSGDIPSDMWDAIARYLRAAQSPDQLVVYVLALVDGVHGTNHTGEAVGRAFRDMAIAGVTRPTTRMIRRFIETADNDLDQERREREAKIAKKWDSKPRSGGDITHIGAIIQPDAEGGE